PEGAGFRSKNLWNLVASDDEWTAPIAADVGPDGNVWFIDWYNFIVQHNPTPAGFKTGRGNAYETNLRDKTHGRIYRLVFNGGDARARPSTGPPLRANSRVASLKDAPAKDLIAALNSDNMFWRLWAQRLLVERANKDVVPQLLELLKDPGSDALGL